MQTRFGNGFEGTLNQLLNDRLETNFFATDDEDDDERDETVVSFNH